ncbi:MAG: AraC family transcriptional regulator [Polyangia bacterium]
MSSPSWWRAAAFDASLETLTDPGLHATCNQPGQERELPPAIAMQLGLAGWGYFRLGSEEPQQIGPGRSFFFETSGLSHYLPAGSPGWTFVRLAIYHPYLKARLADQVSVNGPLFDLHPDEALTASLLRLVRGAIRKDFQDQFEAEMALFTFVLGFERRSQQTTSETRSAQRMMDDVRAHVLAHLPGALSVHALAAEFGMSRSHFSHLFHARTGRTPAHFAVEVRLQKAADLLIDTRDPLKAIAGACGFANANHLCKVFRRVRRQSPTSYRRMRG